ATATRDPSMNHRCLSFSSRPAAQVLGSGFVALGLAACSAPPGSDVGGEGPPVFGGAVGVAGAASGGAPAAGGAGGTDVGQPNGGSSGAAEGGGNGGASNT